MNVHIVMPMPSEAELREWERGITRVVGLRGPSFEVRDPAFMVGEPNPVVEIRTEDGRILWSQWSDSFRRWVGLPPVPVPAVLEPGWP